MTTDRGSKDSRVERSKRNRRGRKNPSRVPSKLTRTPAFAPRSRGLNTDSRFERVYVVPGHSVVRISGRELGWKHRDMLYALFRLKPHRKSYQRDIWCEVVTTWRELLSLTGKTHHTNNLRTILELFKDFQKVVIEVQYGKTDRLLEAAQQGALVGRGFSENILRTVVWDGDGLDDQVTVQYGEWVREMIERKHLVSLNAEVQFSLSSEFAKSFWPFIDSQPNWSYIDEELLAELAGIDLWSDQEVERGPHQGKSVAAAEIRAQFRKNCRQAFDDMVRAGGLKDWYVEVTGSRKLKSRRYHYRHALPRQGELDLKLPESRPQNAYIAQ